MDEWRRRRSIGPTAPKLPSSVLEEWCVPKWKVTRIVSLSRANSAYDRTGIRRCYYRGGISTSRKTREKRGTPVAVVALGECESHGNSSY